VNSERITKKRDLKFGIQDFVGAESISARRGEKSKLVEVSEQIYFKLTV